MTCFHWQNMAEEMMSGPGPLEILQILFSHSWKPTVKEEKGWARILSNERLCGKTKESHGRELRDFS